MFSNSHTSACSLRSVATNAHPAGLSGGVSETWASRAEHSARTSVSVRQIEVPSHLAVHRPTCSLLTQAAFDSREDTLVIWVPGYAANLHKILTRNRALPQAQGTRAPSADCWLLSLLPVLWRQCLTLLFPSTSVLWDLRAPSPPIILALGCPTPKADGVE